MKNIKLSFFDLIMITYIKFLFLNSGKISNRREFNDISNQNFSKSKGYNSKAGYQDKENAVYHRSADTTASQSK